MIDVTGTTAQIVGPTPESIRQLRRDFKASSSEWTRRADTALEAGDTDRALTYRGIADLAARVARGRS